MKSIFIAIFTIFLINTLVYVEYVIDIHEQNQIGISRIQIDTKLEFSILLICQKTSENNCHQI